jgi:hypothetical protein
MASLNSGVLCRILGDWPRIQKDQTVNAKRSSPHSPAAWSKKAACLIMQSSIINAPGSFLPGPYCSLFRDGA